MKKLFIFLLLVSVILMLIFKSSYKNLIIAGTSIQFKDGVYSTSDETEIEILRNNNLVAEAGE